ncbi:MAG: hypothetical protein C0485_09070 [Pirellula sp.]|nr:hypothetical protein [Pirellula sp.]
MSQRLFTFAWLIAVAAIASVADVRALANDLPTSGEEVLSAEQSEIEPADGPEPAPAETLIDYYNHSQGESLSDIPDCAASCELSQSSTRFWASAEYLLWGNEGMYVPALVTTSPTGTSSSLAGILNNPNVDTTILKGESHFNDDVRSGGRFELGMWLDPAQRDSLALTYFFIGQGSASYHVDVSDNPIIARPFFNVSSGAEDARLITYPNLVQGTVDITAESAFHAAAFEYRRQAVRSGRYKIDWLFGYTYAQLDENVTIRDSTLSLSGVTQGTAINLYDAFDSSNAFHGASFGIAAHEELGELWTGDVFAKGSLGGVASRTNISGETETTLNNVTTTNAGGLLTQTSNLGTHRDGYVSSAWQLGLKLRRRLTTNTSLTLGYSWFLLSDVERAGEQIDLGVNVTQIPPGNLVGAARPAFPSEKSTFWTQGLTFGLEARF